MGAVLIPLIITGVISLTTAVVTPLIVFAANGGFKKLSKGENGKKVKKQNWILDPITDAWELFIAEIRADDLRKIGELNQQIERLSNQVANLRRDLASKTAALKEAMLHLQNFRQYTGALVVLSVFLFCYVIRSGSTCRRGNSDVTDLAVALSNAESEANMAFYMFQIMCLVTSGLLCLVIIGTLYPTININFTVNNQEINNDNRRVLVMNNDRYVAHELPVDTAGPARRLVEGRGQEEETDGDSVPMLDQFTVGNIVGHTCNP